MRLSVFAYHQTQIMNNNEVYAAIALALHEHLGNNVHDIETGKITIAERMTMWNLASLSMTAHP